MLVQRYNMFINNYRIEVETLSAEGSARNGKRARYTKLHTYICTYMCGVGIYW